MRVIIVSAIAIITASVMGVLALGLYLLGPTIEQKWFPVIGEARVADTEIVDGRLAFRLSIVKYRGCKILDASWFRRENTVTAAARLVSLTSAPLVNRPIGASVGT